MCAASNNASIGREPGSVDVGGNRELVIPAKKMTFDREIVFKDRNGDERLCIAEALETKHQVPVLIRDIGPRTPAGIVVLPTMVHF